MKRAAGNVVGTSFLQRYGRVDHVNDVNTIEQFLDELFWYHGMGIMA